MLLGHLTAGTAPHEDSLQSWLNPLAFASPRGLVSSDEEAEIAGEMLPCLLDSLRCEVCVRQPAITSSKKLWWS